VGSVVIQLQAGECTPR